MVCFNEMHRLYYEFRDILSASFNCQFVIATQLIKPSLFASLYGGFRFDSVDFFYNARIKEK